MKRRDGFVIGLLALLLAAVVAAEVRAPEPIDWRPNYEGDAAEPYGSRVLFEQLPAVTGATVEAADRPPYLVLRDTLAPPRTYLFVTDRIGDPNARRSELPEATLVDFVARGNTVFLAIEEVALLQETFGTGVSTESRKAWYQAADSATVPVRFASRSLAGDTLRVPSAYIRTYIATFDTARTTVLASTANGEVLFARVAVGAGSVLLTTVPLAFTNYALLEDADAAAFAWSALAYLPADQPILWDTQYKPLRAVVSSPLRYVLRERGLRGAVYVSLLGLVLYMLTRARRRQRPIPIVTPPRNDTLAFVQTVGDLYYQRGDHADLAQKKKTINMATRIFG